MAVILFEQEDADYLQWITDHPDGYVVNAMPSLDPDYLVLHRASCRSINRYPRMDENPGGFTERQYRKLCSLSLAELEGHLRAKVVEPDPFSQQCTLCLPV